MTNEPASTERAYHDQRRYARVSRPRVGEWLLLLLGLSLATLALEGAARVARSAEPEKGGYSPVRGHRSREPMNATGYRDVEHVRQKAAGVHRAIFVGDSFTYGVGVLFDDTYPKRTERALSTERSEEWESIVLAVPGIGAEEEAAIVENEALGYAPDVVILGFVLNDAEDANAAERRRAADWTNAEAEKRNPPLWRRSVLLSLVADRHHATRENRQRIENHLALHREGAPGFLGARKALDRIAMACRGRGVPSWSCCSRFLQTLWMITTLSPPSTKRWERPWATPRAQPSWTSFPTIAGWTGASSWSKGRAMSTPTNSPTGSRRRR